MAPSEDEAALPPEAQPETRLASARFWIAAVGAVLAFGLGAAAAEGLRLPEGSAQAQDPQPVAQADTPFQTTALQNAAAYPVTVPEPRRASEEPRATAEDLPPADADGDGDAYVETAGPPAPETYASEGDPTPAVVFTAPDADEGADTDHALSSSPSASGAPD